MHVYINVYFHEYIHITHADILDTSATHQYLSPSAVVNCLNTHPAFI